MTHAEPAAQTNPHPPQLATLVLVLVQVIAAPHGVSSGFAQICRQAPITQLCVPGHTVPQAPQLRRSVCVFTQRPGDIAVAPQTTEPAAHVPPQTPAAQVAVPPLGAAHARPHAPQLLTVVLVLVSQPLATIASQSPKPALQVSRHAPLVHAAAWLAPAVQARPHAPQLARAVLMLVSQPFAAIASQLPKPALQVSPHIEAPQEAVAFAPPAQAVAHAPQLVTLVVVLMHMPPQSMVGAAQVVRQVPAEQFCPAGHALPQAPQCARSV